MVITIICFVFYKWQIGKIKVHCHSYAKPIASSYVSFNSRDIVYECRCGERKIIREYRDFSDPFPIETSINMTRSELQKIAYRKE